MPVISLLEIFPPELIEKVIDSIPPDDAISGFKALSTVAQCLRPLCHKRLFATVTITTRAMPGRKSLASKLLDALVDSPHLALYTTRLNVLINDEDPVSQRAIPRILAFYNSSNTVLRKFILRQIMPSNLGVREPAIRKEVVKALKMESLVYVELKDVPIDIIRYCPPSVRHLALWNPHLETEKGEKKLHIPSISFSAGGRPSSNSAQPQLQQGPRLKIQSLLVDDGTLTQGSENRNTLALKWLLEQQDKFDFTGLKKLRVGVTSCELLESHQAVADLLLLCADSLEEWSFTPALRALAKETRGHDDPVKLDSLPSLKYLHIGVQTGFWRADDTNIYDPMNWVYSLLSSVPPSSKGSNNKGKNKDENNTNTNNKNKNNIKTLTLSSSFGMMPIPNTILNANPGSSPPPFPSSDPSATNYFGPSFQMYPTLDVLLSMRTRFPSLQRVNFHIEEAPYYKDYMEVPHTFSVRAKWIEEKIKDNMHALVFSNRMKISSNLFPYSTRLLLDADW